MKITPLPQDTVQSLLYPLLNLVLSDQMNVPGNLLGSTYQGVLLVERIANGELVIGEPLPEADEEGPKTG